MEEQIVDTREQGVSGLRGVNRKKQPSRQEQFNMAAPVSGSPYSTMDILRDQTQGQLQSSSREYIGNTELGQSRYDDDISQYSQTLDLNNTRGELQPWYDQLGAGVAKMGILAGTTFLDGTIGVVAGIGNIITGGEDGRPEFSDFWNNPVSKALQSVNEWSETAIPNYYTNEELKNTENGEWYKDIFSANFIGDKVLKNFGFAVGAFYSGKLYTGLLTKAMTLSKARTAFKTAGTLGGDVLKGEQAVSALKSGNAALAGEAIISEAAAAAKQIKTAPWIMKTVGGVTGALGEAKIEALHTSKDNMEYKIGLLNKDEMIANETESFLNSLTEAEKEIYGKNLLIDAEGNITEQVTPEGQAIINQRVDKKYNDAVKKIAEDAKDVGNMDFILNMSLLSLSNMWQFGKAYAGGYNTGKKAIGSVVKEGGEEAGKLATYAYKAPNKLKTFAKIASNPLVEGNEEMMQQAAAFASGYKYNSSDTFNMLGINDVNSNKSLSLLEAMGKGVLDTYGDASQWEQFAIGALTGIVGVPQVSFSKIKSGNYNPMAGGVWEDIKDYRESTKEEREKVDTLNKRLSDPKYIELYKGLIRHQTLDTAMVESLENNDSFNFKNAEHQQMISDIITFHNTGRLQDFFDNIDSMASVQLSDIDDIKSQSVNKQTGKSIFDNATKDEDVINHVKKQADKLKKASENYKKIYDTISVTYGENLDSEIMSEMIYKISNIDNLENRFNEVFKDVKDKFKPYAEIFKNDTYKDENGDNVPIINLLNENPQDFLNNFTVEQAKLAESFIKNADSLNKQNEKVDAKKAANNNRGLSQSLKRLKRLQELVDKHAEIFSTIPEFSKQISDLSKIINLRKEFIDDHITFTKNPNLLIEKINNEKAEIAQVELGKQNEEVKTNLANAESIADFKSIFDSIEDNTQKSEILNSLIESGNEIAKKFKELKDFKKEVIENINLNGNISREQKDNAIKIFNSRMSNSNTLEQVANLSTLTAENVDESVKIDNVTGEVLFTDEQLTNEILPIIFNAIKKAVINQKFKSNIKVVPLVTDSEIAEKENNPPQEGQPINKVNSSPIVNTVASGGAVTSTEAKQSNESLNDVLTKSEEALIPVKEQEESPREYWNQAVQELDINAKKKKIFVFNKVTNPRFANIIEFLEKKGAFNYVNSGKLSIDDKVSFMIDPTAFSDLSIEDQSKLAGVIFMTTTDSNGDIQIIGVLPESNAHKFKGLKAFRQNLLQEYAEFQKTPESANSPFISKSTVKVANIIPGNVMTTDNKFNFLKGMKGTENGVIFGIMQNGKIIAPRTDINDYIVDPKDSGNREGRLYMLVKGADNKYYPVLVISRQFNAKDFNMNDAAIRETSRYKNIMRGINQLAAAKTQEEVTSARNLIDEELYMGDYSIDYKEGGQLIIRKKQTGVKAVNIKLYNDGFNPDESAGFEIDDDGKVISNPAPDAQQIQANRRPVEYVANEIITYIQEQGAYIQMSKNQLNDKNGYNQSLLDDNLLVANIESAEMFGGWFQTTYIDEAGNEKEAKAFNTPTVESSTHNSTETVTNGKESVIPGQLVVFKDGKYFVQEDGTILNDGGKPVLRMDNYVKSLLIDLAYIRKNFSDLTWRKLHSSTQDFTDKDGNKKRVRGVITPDKRVVDISNNPVYLNDTMAKAFIDAHNKSLSTPTPIVVNNQTQVSTSNNVIFDKPNSPFIDRYDIPIKERPSLPTGTQGVRDGYYLDKDNRIIRAEIAPLAVVHGVQIYQTPDSLGGILAVYPNGKTRGKATNTQMLIDVLNRQPENVILDLSEEGTILTGGKQLSLKKANTTPQVKEAPIKEEIKVVETPTKPKKELTPEQQAKLKAMAEREAKLRGQSVNSQESKDKEHAETSKKLFPDKENSSSSEKKSVKSLDNSNKKLTFAEINEFALESIKKKFSEREWNELTREEQDKEIECNTW